MPLMNQLVASFPKGKFEEVQLHIHELKGHELVDLRVYASLKEGDEKVATGKGLSVSIPQFLDLKKAVLKMEAVLRESRLIHE